MSYKPSYRNGDWKGLCEVCGRVFKYSQLLKRWDGFMVCEQDFELRNPQDFVKDVPESELPPWTRPEGSDTFVP